MNANALSLKMKTDLNECKLHKNIMDDVIELLQSDNIDYKINGKKTEIKVTKPKGEIVKKLREEIPLPYMVFRLLFNIVEVKGKTYIRIKRR